MDIAEQIAQLTRLRDAGVLSVEEFDAKVRQVVTQGGGSAPPQSSRTTSPTGVSQGDRVGVYDLLEKVGDGGMGAVYRGRHRITSMAARQGGDVAVKLVHPHLLSKGDMAERFRREAETLAALDHPNIVRIFDVVDAGGRTAIVMEWVPGRPLSAVIGKETGPIPWERAQRLVGPILSAVAHAHGRGVIHRDLKPENIVVTQAGEIKLLDFGIARLGEARGRTKTGTGMGSVDYMAPEQFLDAKSVDERADVYALGMTIYQMVAGRLPWDTAQGEYEVMRRKERGEIPPPTAFYPSIPPWVVDGVMSALVPSPSARTSSVEALSASLAGPRPSSANPAMVAARGATVSTREAAPVAAPVPPLAREDVEERTAPRVSRTETTESANVPSAQVEPLPAVPVVAGRGAPVRVAGAVLALGAVGMSYSLWSTPGPRVGSTVRQSVVSSVLGPLEWVPDGSFTMGSPPSESGRGLDETQHWVTLTQGFWMMRSEVTQAMWFSVMGTNPSERSGCTDCPVENVSVEEAESFAQTISALDGVTYRLPTEAEWEWSARGGESLVYAGSNNGNDVGLTSTNSSRSHPGCERPRNGFGLCDMTGNVWEWTADGYGDYPTGSVTDPRGPATGSNAVARGGSWHYEPSFGRVANRFSVDPGHRYPSIGFRLIRTFP